MQVGSPPSWMARMFRRISAVAALASLALAAPALAAPKANTITAIGGMKVKANGYVMDDQRWDANGYSVKSGATVTLRDKSTMGQPHSLSLIAKRPKGDQAIMECKACGPLIEGHGADPETMEAETALVNAGADGFDTAGDSIWLPAKGKVTFKVTAKKGSTLNFVCVIHPWMLGKITVK
jgi:plastocyanin